MAASASAGTGALSVGLTWNLLSIKISTDNVEIAHEVLESTKVVIPAVSKAAVTLGALYGGYRLLRPVIEGVVKKCLGGERDDQRDPDMKPGSLRVLLHCLTDKRFLEILKDFESGRMKRRLQEEFFQAEIIVTGLKVEIENFEEVYKTKEVINNRYVIVQEIFGMLRLAT